MAMAAANGAAGPYPMGAMPIMPMYGLIPGFQAGHPAGGAPLHMSVSPQAATLAAAAAASMQPVTTTATIIQNNIAAAQAVQIARHAQQLYQFAPPGALQLAPLL